MEKHKDARMKRSNFSNLCNIGFAGAMNGAYLLGIGFCGYGILTGTMSYGNLMAIMQLVGQAKPVCQHYGVSAALLRHACQRRALDGSRDV